QRTIYDDDAADVDPTSIDIAIFCLEQIIDPTRDGERDLFIRITAAARAGGDQLFPAWSDWASRGHHGSGSRARQSTEKFFRGMRGSSLGSLFYFASKSDPDWRKKLPEELRQASRISRGSSDTFAGYDWEDFLGDPCEETTAREAVYGLFDPDAPWAQVAAPAPERPKTSPSSAAGYDDADFQGDPDNPAPAKRGPGRPKKNTKDPVENIMARLRRLYPGLRQNVISQQLEFGPKDNPQVVPDASTTYVRISRGSGEVYPKTMVNDLMQVLGYENQYNPVHAYLDDCLASNAPCSYFDTLATELLGLSDDELENPPMPDGQRMADVVLRRALIGAVARTMQPGCDMDWMPILVGSQNLGKSAFFRYLVPPQRRGVSWVTTLQQGITAVKERPHILHCGWIVLLDEVERYFKRRYVEELKNLISTSNDFSAKKYQNELLYPRSFILAGATNSRDFLQDPTGNRRFMPILAKGVVRSPENPSIKIIDLDRLKADRDSIWAAAHQAYLAGESWMFTSYEIAHLAAYVDSFSTDSSIEQRVATELTRTRTGVYRGRSFVTLSDLFAALKTPLEQQQSMLMAVSDALKKLGWTMKRIRIFGKTTRVWLAPEEEPNPSQGMRPVRLETPGRVQGETSESF
ncbi:MAG: VapE domain-containing protein, partial [Cyanobium sp.]|nr:VapE domain-containing protein [Cyanobium sp.]